MKIEAKEHLTMTAVVFDSLTLVKRLSASGMPSEQAEAVVNMTRDVMLSVPTKDDIDAGIRTLDPKLTTIDQRFAAIDQHFAAIDHRFDIIEQKFTILEQRLTMKLGSISVVALGAFTAISKLIG